MQEGQETIFLTDSGTAFQPGTIGKRITTWWRKATGKSNINSTSLRKMHASQLYTTEPISKASAHRLMCHSSRTAERFYMMNNLTDMAVRGHTTLQANIKLKDTVPTCSENQRSPTRGMTNQQLDDIDLLFADIIKTNAPLSMCQTRNIMSDPLSFVTSVDDEGLVKKVMWRVKYLQRRDATPDILEEQDSATKTSSWVEEMQSKASSSKRRCWCQEDVAVIEREFESLENCPNKEEISCMFQDRQPLAEISQRNTFQRCYEKVKNIFKKKNS